MHMTFDKKRDWIYEVDFNLPFDQRELMDDLRNDDWQGDDSGYNMNPFSKRYRLHAPRSPRLQEIQRWFMGDEFKQHIMNQLYSEEWWSGYWGISPKRMWERTTVFGNLTLDKPGFGTGIHLDNRTLVAVGMCYFIDGDDPQQSTYFYTSKDKDNELRIPTGFGKGWIAANMHDSWHDGFNRSEKDRYNALLGLVIRF